MASQEPRRGTEPLRANSKEEFGAAMKRHATEMNRGSMRELARQSQGTSIQLSAQTMSDWYNGKYLPTSESFERWLGLFDVPPEEAAEWQKLRNTLSSVERRGRPAGPEIDRARGELKEAYLEIDGLRACEAELRAELEKEKTIRQETEHKLGQMIRDLADARLSAEIEREHFSRHLTEHWQRIEVSTKNIGALEYQLGLVEGQRARAEAELTRLQARLDELEVASSEIEDLRGLEFERAEFERRRREELEAGLVSKDKEIERLKGLVAEYQALVNQPDPQKNGPSSSVVAAAAKRDKDRVIKIRVKDADFGRRVPVEISYAWFCVRCRFGGEQSHSACPHCRSRVERNYIRKTLVELPERSRYSGEPLQCEGLGNHDNPNTNPGNILIELVLLRN
jgi:hypothetical protein